MGPAVVSGLISGGIIKPSEIRGTVSPAKTSNSGPIPLVASVSLSNDGLVQKFEAAMRDSRMICPCTGKEGICTTLLAQFKDALELNDPEMITDTVKDLISTIKNSAPNTDHTKSIVREFLNDFASSPHSMPITPEAEWLMASTQSTLSELPPTLVSQAPNLEIPISSVPMGSIEHIKEVPVVKHMEVSVLKSAEPPIPTTHKTILSRLCNIPIPEQISDIVHQKEALSQPKSSGTLTPTEMTNAGNKGISKPPIDSQATSSVSDLPRLNIQSILKELVLPIKNTTLADAPVVLGNKTNSTPLPGPILLLQAVTTTQSPHVVNQTTQLMMTISEKMPTQLAPVMAAIVMLTETVPTAVPVVVKALSDVMAHFETTHSERPQTQTPIGPTETSLPTPSIQSRSAQLPLKQEMLLPAKLIETVTQSIVRMAQDTPHLAAPIAQLISSAVQSKPTISLMQATPPSDPKILEATATTLKSVSQHMPQALESVATTLLSVSQNAPRSLPAIIMTVNRVAVQTPAIGPTLLKLVNISLTLSPQIFKSVSLSLGSVAKFAPKGLEAAISVLATASQKQPESLVLLSKVFASTAISSPLLLKSVIELFDQVRRTQPAEMESVAHLLSQFSTQRPGELKSVITLLTTVLEKSPEALRPVVLCISDVATRSPQSLKSILLVLTEIARTYPHLLETTTKILAALSKFGPILLDKAIQLLATLASKSPQSLPAVVQGLRLLSQLNPEFLATQLTVFHELADKNPALLVRFSEVLTEWVQMNSKSGNRLSMIEFLRLMPSIQNQKELMELLIRMGDISISESAPIVEFLAKEAKKSRRTKCDVETDEKIGFTDDLIHLFDRLEMEHWKTAALFRKQLSRKDK